jgi:thymidylate synthase ThyX
MIDYGHQSIADMAPVAIFADGLSMWLVYYLWTLCPTAGGQESSTRYIKISPEALPPAQAIGLQGKQATDWENQSLSLLNAYGEALQIWEALVNSNPKLANIPDHLLADTSDRATKTVTRMLRNYAFDRARYFLPLACRTNVMLIMSAGAWAKTTQHLLSHQLPEANALGHLICEELGLGAPRMLRHAGAKESTRSGIVAELNKLAHQAITECAPYLHPATPGVCDHPAEAYLDVMLPAHIEAAEYRDALLFHENRYAWIGQQLRRVSVRFGWQAMAMAEVRDLNRHRTGNKYCPLLPLGFYCAEDQLPVNCADQQQHLRRLATQAHQTAIQARILLTKENPAYVYYMTLGTQVPFEHLTTADKFLYEVQLRTGTGSHYRYAQHMRDVLKLWHQRFPQTRDLVLEGSAEPE